MLQAKRIEPEESYRYRLGIKRRLVEKIVEISVVDP